MLNRGFFAVGIWHPKTEVNIGTLWRSAGVFGASFLFTVGTRYKTQSSDTAKTPRHIPLFHFDHIDELRGRLPNSCPLIGIEMSDGAENLENFYHPERACYLLGAEDHGLSPELISRCHKVLRLPGKYSLNVAVAGSIVLWTRYQQFNKNND